MPTQQQLNDDFTALINSSEWQAASIEQKSALFTSFLEARQTLWEHVGEYIVNLFEIVMDAINGNPVSVAIATLIDDWFSTTLQIALPWPLSGAGE
jgi:putative methionine-R-sulfoxide reductase with GAF domain